ncbi:MAG TPA: AfsR/SARP family transcriptional regulator, partial [Rugosimonospora sp.]|nr:AfsR/SARP family transcriptional regulator [Rugosimonospora sp.]
MRIRLLGPLDVVVDGVPRPVPGLRRRAILAVLALNRGKVVGTDQLIDAVWDGAAPATVGNTLQRNMSHLRQLLGDPGAIQARPPGYLLRTAGDEPTDAEAAEQLARQAGEEGDPGTRARRLREALALWRGSSLVDVAGLPWLDRQAERLEQLRLRVRRELIDARLDLGEHAQLLPELAQLATEHPFEEHVHGRLILALYRAGQPVEALATYRRLRDNLRDELGIDPGPELRALEAAVLRQDPSLAPAAAVATVPAPPARVPAQLPAAVYAFAGRTAELAALDAMLAAATGTGLGAAVVISAVSGSAGVGKTSLAVYWAHRVAAQFPDGQLYVNLRGFDPTGVAMDPGEALRGFLYAFGVPAERVPLGLTAQAALYRSLLATRRVLVVLDNARDGEQVRPLLPGAPGCLAVVTSRNQLTSLVAVEGAQPLAVDLLSPAEARDLLARRLGEPRV